MKQSVVMADSGQRVTFKCDTDGYITVNKNPYTTEASKVVTLENLEQYDKKIKEYINQMLNISKQTKEENNYYKRVL